MQWGLASLYKTTAFDCIRGILTGILWRKYVYIYTITVYIYTITVYNLSRGIYVKGMLYSPDAGHSGREESAEWLDLATGGTIAAVHNILSCSTDEWGSEHLIKWGPVCMPLNTNTNIMFTQLARACGHFTTECYTHAHTHTYLPTYLPTYLHTCIHTYIHAYMHTHAVTNSHTVTV